MKSLFRSILFVLFVGGWALASAAVYVVRTPSKFVIITKDHFGYRDTYVDTRLWTMPDDRAHATLVARLVELNRTDVLAHTVNAGGASVAAQLSVIAATSPTPSTANPDLTGNAKAELKTVTDEVKSKLN
jgi:hypothetical protein